MIQIVFENENFVLCDKESGVLSTPSRHEDVDARRCLGTELQTQLKIQIYPVHRLDFEVSGLVLFAKNPHSHSAANTWFEKSEVTKTYRALTSEQDYSHIPSNISNPRAKINLQDKGQCFSWESRVLRGKRRAYESPLGKVSRTEATFLGHDGQGNVQWDLQPVTGRSHQLRFDLSRHGFAILGDALYGSKVQWRESGIALRSYSIDFSRARGALALGLPERFDVVPL